MPSINDAINAIMQVRTIARNAPLEQAVQQANQQYPWVRNLGVPVKLFRDIGPYWSESYDPKESQNPYPGQFGIGLRSAQSLDPKTWVPLIGREAIDYMARHDPVYEKVANQFIDEMQKNPQQLAVAKKRWKSEGNDDGTFEDWLHEAEAQEWIGGYVGDMPHWKNMPYSPAQRKLLDAYKQHIWAGQKPTPLNID